MLTALEEMDFESFIDPLRDTLEAYRTIAKAKKAVSRLTNADSEAMEQEPNQATN